MPQAGVTRGGKALIVLSNNLYTVILSLPFGHNSWAAVGRAIVDNYQLKVFLRLL
ncbi:hypothetical protein D3C81_2211610 [compost metagenome]